MVKKVLIVGKSDDDPPVEQPAEDISQQPPVLDQFQTREGEGPAGAIKTGTTGVDANGDVWWTGPEGFVKIGTVPAVPAPEQARGQSVRDDD